MIYLDKVHIKSLRPCLWFKIFSISMKDLERAIQCICCMCRWHEAGSNNCHAGDQDASLNRSQNAAWLQKKSNIILRWKNNL